MIQQNITKNQTFSNSTTNTNQWICPQNPQEKCITHIPCIRQVIKKAVRQRDSHKHGPGKSNQSRIITDRRNFRYIIIRSFGEFNKQIDSIAHHCQTSKGHNEVKKLQKTLPASSTCHPQPITILQSLNHNSERDQKCPIYIFCRNKQAFPYSISITNK